MGMIREEYLRRLVDNAYLDLYLSATDGARLYWPWRMMPVHEADKRHRNACESFIIDSSIQRDDIGNEQALDKAYQLNAEMVVLADVWHDPEATVERILDGLDAYDDHPYEGRLIAPLQPPHAECYAELEGQPIDIYAVGGVKDASDHTRIQAAQSLRDAAGPDPHIHGLGYGATEGIVSAVRENPLLLDSIDYSTPMQSVQDGTIDAGRERMSVAAARAAARLVEDLRKFSAYPEIPEQTHRQSGLSEVMVR